MIRLKILALAAIALPLIAIGQQTINGSITHDGLERDYILYIPEMYDPGASTPLVLNFHGYTSNSNEQMQYGDFRPIADTAGFLVVHPQGTKDLLGNTHWNVGWGASSVDDVGFTDALIDSLSSAYNIDAEKIYSTGMSNGGFMSYTLACDLSDQIAAIASVTGSMTLDQPGTCSPDHPVPVMEIHGTADNVVPYNGSVLFETIPDVLSYWTGFNNCNSEPIITDIPDIDPNDGCTVEHHLYEDGDVGVEVSHFKVINGGHTWPGAPIGGSGTNQDIDASTEIWTFFSRYDINGLIVPTGTENIKENQTITNVYPNPGGSSIYVELNSTKHSEYQLISLDGQLLLSGMIVTKPQKIDISQLAKGMYVLKVGTESQLIVKTSR